jgi:hypothetical protein
MCKVWFSMQTPASAGPISRFMTDRVPSVLHARIQKLRGANVSMESSRILPQFRQLNNTVSEYPQFHFSSTISAVESCFQDVRFSRQSIIISDLVHKGVI